VAFLNGTNNFVIYSINDASSCQCDSVCENRSPTGVFFGSHLSVFPPKMYWIGRTSPASVTPRFKVNLTVK
jgi:hypothetical protein